MSTCKQELIKLIELLFNSAVVALNVVILYHNVYND